MIDFVRMNFKENEDVKEFICDKENFSELRVVLEKHSGTIEYPYNANLENMDIIVTEQNICVKNSLHKLNNFRKHKINKNHNDFKYSELIENIGFIQNSLLNLHESRLSKLEFGLNIELTKPAEFIIRNNIIMHKYNLHSHNKKFEGRGEFKQFDHSNYDIKIYDKAKQYDLKKYVLRFEIKHKTSKSFNPLGIYNILDLRDKKKLKSLFNDMLKRFDEMIIIDDYKTRKDIPEDIKMKLERYTSYNFWEELSQRNTRNKKSKEFKRFNQILEKYNLLTTKSGLKSGFLSKFDYLINN